MKQTKKEKFVWIDCIVAGLRKDKMTLINNLNFENIVINASDLKDLKVSKKMNVIILVNNIKELEDLPRDNNLIVLSNNIEILEAAKKKLFKTAWETKIVDQETMDQAWQEGMNHNFLVTELISETNIPLELLIAKLQKTETKLLKKVNETVSAEIAFGVMEEGSEGVYFKNEDLNELLGLQRLMQKQSSGKINLVKGKVINVEHIGMGFRACIDTTNLLNSDEGMLIGSTSNGGLLVSSETHYLPYMNLRPFRVNAGAIHSYVWCPDNSSPYLTELKAGSKVMCVDTEGNYREVTVGRVKTESRPLLKIEVSAEGKTINTIVQDDWHIRIFGGKGEPLNASEIKQDDELLCYICEGGRHVGIKIDESIYEV